MLYAIPNLRSASTEEALLICLCEAQKLYSFSAYFAAQILSILEIASSL
jgi:hypothetical protein